MSHLVWFRRDLRAADHPALHHAAERAHDEGTTVTGVFFVTPKQWLEHDEAAVKVQFWLENLRCLRDRLEKLNIPLIVETCETFHDLPDQLETLAKKIECTDLHFNLEYEFNECQRDERVRERCEALEIEVHTFHGRVIIPPKNIETNEGKFYSVFTPYRRSWDQKLSSVSEPLHVPKRVKVQDLKASSIPKSIEGYDFNATPIDRWPAGEDEAARRLDRFLTSIDEYDEQRDLPSVDGTSGLSPYLAAGVISPRQCLDAVFGLTDGDLDKNEGAKTWVSELTWRDFYAHVLVGCPRVSKSLPFKKKTRDIRWREDKNEFQAWCEGRTGFPIVDAGMRQLNEIGWMHNRLRMVTAMFLTKHLLIDWRWGERYFMQHLVDGDLAANNGGWQWSASTGTDAVPYFRIFNPFSQSKRFDEEGEFIRKYCPELADIPASSLHNEKKLRKAVEEHQIDYPDFLVEHKTGRERALKEFKRVG
jgi:deoxyribodipyrimidine photo-lyase